MFKEFEIQIERRKRVHNQEKRFMRNIAAPEIERILKRQKDSSCSK